MKDPRPIESRLARQRHILDVPLEVRAAGEGGSIAFTGHGIVYDREATIYDWWFGEYKERIAPGAAAAHLGDDVRLLINHDANLLLARTTAGTMRLSEDEIGVLVDADMAPTAYARDLAILLERGDISQMSFSFIAGDEEWEMDPGGTWHRTITSFAGLYDMSIVTYPAYDETDAGLRAVGQLMRAGRRNSSSDEALIRGAVDTIRTAADDLETIVESSDVETDEEKSAARRALAAQQAAQHAQFKARMGGGVR